MHARPSWLQERATGVLCHPTSLPGDQGIGVLGRHARKFIEFLAQAQVRYWQVLPLGPTGFGDSPYASFSAFAGNPYLIDCAALIDAQLLRPDDLQALRGLPAGRVDYGAIYRTKWPILRHAWNRFRDSGRAYIANYGLFTEFVEQEASWLLPYARFMALKDHYGGRFRGTWPAHLRSGPRARDAALWRELDDAVQAHSFFQYLFRGQWNLIRSFAAARGVQIIGDIPIFVAHDSADVWSQPQWFKLDDAGMPVSVAGVPPDYFSATGQLWGNPLYRWEAMADDGWRWWIDRLRMNFALFDIVRIDHFRGFYDYWEIPAGATDATTGAWRDGPGKPFFDAVFAALPQARIIAEDLGEIHEEIRSFRASLGLPGMAVLHFAFDGDGANFHLPHNHESVSVVYTGTHDNDTSTGWYESAPAAVQDRLRRYYRVSGDDVAWDLIRSAYRSVSRLAIVPVQDLLALGGEARMNLPGSAQGNWQWRASDEQFEWLQGSAAYLRELAWLYGRQPHAEAKTEDRRL
jgi:4-alpha-glucanotransferase